LVEHGITRVLASPATCDRLCAGNPKVDPRALRALGERTRIGSALVPVDFLPLDHVAASEGGAVHLPDQAVLFAGPVVVNGPHAALAGSDTARWIATLREFEALAPVRVIPGLGSWGGPELLKRQRRFLTELRRQVGYQIAQGRPRAGLDEQVRPPAD